MATEFTSYVKKGGTVGTDCDYTTLSSAEAGLQNDLTLSTSMVFSVSSASSPTIAAGDGVTGNTSGATGTCVLVNYLKNQIWIKSISGTFQSGEQVRKTADALVYVNISDAGATVICGICCRDGSVDSTAVTISGWTTDATHYIRIYGQNRVTVPYTSSRYRLETTGGNTLTINEEFVRIENISIKHTSNSFANSGRAINFGVSSSTNDVRITGCYIKGVTHASNTSPIYGIETNNNEKLTVSNCIFEGWKNVGNTGNAAINRLSCVTIVVQNCQAINCATGLKGLTTAWTIKNFVYDAGSSGNALGFSGTPNSASDYNSTSDNTAYGTHSVNTQTYTYVDSAGGDYHFATNDAGAVDKGVDLSAATVPVTDDIDGVARTSNWDIGPYTVGAVYNPTLLPFTKIQFRLAA